MFSPTNPTQIIIQPVQNGWIVSLPSSDNGMNNFEDQISQVAPMLKGIVNELREDDDAIGKVIRNAERDMQRQSKLANQPRYVRDNSMHIFDTWEKVLAFLAEYIKD